MIVQDFQTHMLSARGGSVVLKILWLLQYIYPVLLARAGTRSSCHVLQLFVIANTVCDLDEGRVGFSDSFIGDRVEDLVGVGCLRWSF